MNTESPPLLREVQPLPRALPLLAVACPALIAFVGATGAALGGRLPYWPFFGLSAGILGVAGFLVAAIFSLKMITAVRPEGVQIRHSLGNVTATVSLAGIKRVAVVSYAVRRDAHGRGVKSGKGWRAFTIAGERGVRIEYQDGTWALIGSQQPEELARAIGRALRHLKPGQAPPAAAATSTAAKVAWHIAMHAGGH